LNAPADEESIAATDNITAKLEEASVTGGVQMQGQMQGVSQQ
jgi:hypothetical protein